MICIVIDTSFWRRFIKTQGKVLSVWNVYFVTVLSLKNNLKDERRKIYLNRLRLCLLSDIKLLSTIETSANVNYWFLLVSGGIKPKTIFSTFLDKYTIMQMHEHPWLKDQGRAILKQVHSLVFC